MVTPRCLNCFTLSIFSPSIDTFNSSLNLIIMTLLFFVLICTLNSFTLFCTLVVIIIISSAYPATKSMSLANRKLVAALQNHQGFHHHAIKKDVEDSRQQETVLYDSNTCADKTNRWFIETFNCIYNFHVAVSHSHNSTFLPARRGRMPFSCFKYTKWCVGGGVCECVLYATA